MSRNEVTARMPLNLPVGNADWEFVIVENGQKLGSVKVSKGGITVVPRDHTYGFEMPWHDALDMVRLRGRPERRSTRRSA